MISDKSKATGVELGRAQPVEDIFNYIKLRSLAGTEKKTSIRIISQLCVMNKNRSVLVYYFLYRNLNV